MVEEEVISEESDKLNPKIIATDVLYGAVKGLSGLFFKAFMNLRIEGEEFIPVRGKAILTTVAKDIIRHAHNKSSIGAKNTFYVRSENDETSNSRTNSQKSRNDTRD